MADPTVRVLRLLALLTSARAWRGEDLADRLGVTPRTVRRDVERLRELGYRVDRIAEPLATGRRSRPEVPPDAARFVSEGISARPYRWQARVVLEAPADVVTARVPPTVAVVEVLDADRCLLTTGADSLDAIAAHLVFLDVDFTVLDPPELRSRCRELADRLAAAGDQTAAVSRIRTVPSSRSVT